MTPKKSNNPQELLERARSLEIAEIQKRIEAGKVTRTDIARLEKLTKGEPEDIGPDAVRQKSTLAERIPCNRMTLDRHWKKPGAPKPTANGCYSVKAWREYFNNNASIKSVVPDVGNDDATNYKKRREKADAESAEHDLQVRRGEWLPKKKTLEDIKKCNERVKAELTRRLLQTAPAECEAVRGNQDKVREILRKHLTAAMTFIHSGEWKP